MADELRQKIEKYKREIAYLETEIERSDENDVFGFQTIVEARRKIKDYQARIERLQKRIAGQPTIPDCPTDAQSALASWVNSSAYDNE